MAKDPAVLFYTSDFISGTSFFTYAERGQYILLLCQQHQLGSIPENHMISVCGSIDSPVIGKFIKGNDGNYYNERMRIEADKRKRFCESRSNNKSGRPKISNKSKSHDNHMNIHMEDESDNEDESIIGFNLFWNSYDKKVGSKSKIKKKWDKLSTATQQLILKYIPKYKLSQPDKQYRKHPETFLNNESWNDELIFRDNGTNQQDTSETLIAREDWKIHK